MGIPQSPLDFTLVFKAFLECKKTKQQQARVKCMVVSNPVICKLSKNHGNTVANKFVTLNLLHDDLFVVCNYLFVVQIAAMIFGQLADCRITENRANLSIYTLKKLW